MAKFKRLGIILVHLLLFNYVFGQNSYSVIQGKNKLTFSVNGKGEVQYALQYNKQDVLLPSRLGLVIKDHPHLDADFKIMSVDSSSVNETWTPVWGEVNKIINRYKQLTIKLQQQSTGVLMNICFRLFDDGLGFRYEFPRQPQLGYFILSDEKTEFSLAGNHKTFWIPGDFDSNEYPYTISSISEIDNKAMFDKSTDICVRTVVDNKSVQTPLMMKSNDGLYINIHEAALINYPAMQLHVDTKNYRLTSSLVPDAVGNKAYLTTPFTTPWRTVIVSNKAADILSSKLILNLNEPSVIKETSWIKPMKFVGVWWEMQTGKGTWNFANTIDSVDAKGYLIANGKHSANTKNVKRYIDFAAANGIEGVLVEGWNKGWEDWFGNWKENVFDFVTPYEDFDVKQLRAYAKEKGVQIIMHNETSGSATNYDRQMDTAFKFMKENGYHSVKTGYVGKIIPRGETHEGQWMVNHYKRTIEMAAKNNIMIDIHEPTRPTGLHRTYPNFMASEAGRGNEYYAFSQYGNPINHETVLPFTRFMGGPMDFTPGIFKLRNYTDNPDRIFRSTLCKQLALYVILYSPVQMAADLPENYLAKYDAFQFIKDVPSDWDDTKVIDAEPGEYIVTARKAKHTNNWFIGAVNGEIGKKIAIDLIFLEEGKSYEATIYKDAVGTDCYTNPEKYTIQKQKVNNKSVIDVNLAKGGGEAVSIIEIKSLSKNN